MEEQITITLKIDPNTLIDKAKLTERIQQSAFSMARDYLVDEIRKELAQHRYACSIADEVRLYLKQQIIPQVYKDVVKDVTAKIETSQELKARRCKATELLRLEKEATTEINNLIDKAIAKRFK